MDQIEISIPLPTWNEGSSFAATAHFRTRATKAASAPTTADYKITCETTGTTVRDWTSLTPGAAISITVTHEDNAIKMSTNKHELKSITVRGDARLNTQQLQVHYWNVHNLKSI